MKRVLAACVSLGMAFLMSASGADLYDFRSSEDVALELRNQDAALSLLLEAFRQIQGAVIQSDYNSRIHAATALRDIEARHTVAILADIERHLRIKKLGKQLEYLLTAYTYTRKSDEREAGATIPSVVNLEAAAIKLKDFRYVQGSPPNIEADFETPVFISNPVPSTQVPLPLQLQKYMTLLKDHYTNDETLAESVESLLRARVQQSGVPPPNPAMVAISYRRQNQNVTDVVVQLFDHPEEKAESVVANTRLASSRLGPDILGPVDEWLNMLTESQVGYLGPEKEIPMRRRAFRMALQADLTLMREQTVEPLHLIILMPDPERLLPQCLVRRVKAVIIEADLAYGEWQCRVHLMTADDDSGQQVGLLLANWRELAMAAVGIYASSDTHPSAQRALEAGTLEVKGNEVLATGSVPSSLGVRVVAKLTRWSVEEVAWEDEAKMVTICQRGHTKQVRAIDLSACLARGDHVGPCR